MHNGEIPASPKFTGSGGANLGGGAAVQKTCHTVMTALLALTLIRFQDILAWSCVSFKQRISNRIRSSHRIRFAHRTDRGRDRGLQKLTRRLRRMRRARPLAVSALISAAECYVVHNAPTSTTAKAHLTGGLDLRGLHGRST